MKISVLGTGLLGGAVARRLLETGHRVSVYNRTPAKTVSLRQAGAEVCATPGAAVEQSEGVLLLLRDAAAIEQVVFGTDVPLKGRTMIQMGTIAPEESVRLDREVTARGGSYFECPALGSRREALAGKLILMVGASREQFDRWQDFLRSLGPDPRYVGGIGQAAALKLALNQLIASLINAFSLSLGLVQKAGVDRELFMAVLRQSALYAPAFDKKLPRLTAHDYSDPNFTVRNLLKDVDLILGECRRRGLAAGPLTAVRENLAETVAGDLGDGDYAAVHEIVNPGNG